MINSWGQPEMYLNILKKPWSWNLMVSGSNFLFFYSTVACWHFQMFSLACFVEVFLKERGGGGWISFSLIHKGGLYTRSLPYTTLCFIWGGYRYWGTKTCPPPIVVDSIKPCWKQYIHTTTMKVWGCLAHMYNTNKSQTDKHCAIWKYSSEYLKHTAIEKNFMQMAKKVSDKGRNDRQINDEHKSVNLDTGAQANQIEISRRQNRQNLHPTTVIIKWELQSNQIKPFWFDLDITSNYCDYKSTF